MEVLFLTDVVQISRGYYKRPDQNRTQEVSLIISIYILYFISLYQLLKYFSTIFNTCINLNY